MPRLRFAPLLLLFAGPLKFGTDLWFKMTDTPPAWGDKLLLVKVLA